MEYSYTAYVEHDAESGLYVGTIPAVPGAHSQGETLDELQANLREVLQLCIEQRLAAGEPVEDDAFVGLPEVGCARPIPGRGSPRQE